MKAKHNVKNSILCWNRVHAVKLHLANKRNGKINPATISPTPLFHLAYNGRVEHIGAIRQCSAIRKAYSDLLPRAAGKHGASVLCQKMALLVEALNILLSGIWSFQIVGGLRVSLQGGGSIAVTWGMILKFFSKLQGWKKILDIIFSCNHDDKNHWV